MQSPLELNKQYSQINNINEIAYQILFENYIIKDVRGRDKLIEIESTDEESLFYNFNGGYPIPGMIYTFIYKPLKGDEVKIIDGNNIKEYIDYVPLVFCVNTYNLSFSGINLNTLPNQERLKFLVAYYETYKNYMKNVERDTQNNKITWNKKFVELAKSGKAQDLIKSFNSKVAANFNYGYRKYNIDRVDNFRMIEYDEWSYVPFLDPKNSFLKMNQKQIQEFYWKVKK